MGREGVVLRLDEIPPILPDHPELAVEVDRRDAELEGHDAVVLERDDHIPASVHIAPLSGQLALGQPLAVAPYRGPSGAAEAGRKNNPAHRAAASSPARARFPFPRLISIPSSYLPYWNRSHLSMPLYSLRFLSAVRPKVRSNSVWEESTLTRHPSGSVRTARPKAR